MWLAALRRLSGLFLLATGITVVGAMIFGLAAGSDPWRAISLGFYLTGSFSLISGFFVGNRGPVRFRGDSDAPLFWGSRFVRWASPEEREENINLSAIFVLLGFILLILGVAADTRYELA
jgi:hypothetical protein